MMKKLLWLFSTLAIVFTACKKDNEQEQSKATVATSNVTAITALTATSGGSITDDGGSPISQRGIVWATHTEPTLTDSIINDASGAATWVSNLTKLNPNTTYYVRAYATNASGTAYGNEVSFKTLAGLPTVVTAPITGNADFKAKSGGDVTNDGGAAVTARGIVWSKTPNPTIDNFKKEAGNGTGVFEAELTLLEQNTDYYVRAYATNSIGTAYGNEIQFKAASSDKVMDIDGNVYQTVTIGTQTWMASNLRVTKYRNGDEILNGTTPGFNWLAISGAISAGSTSFSGAYHYAGGNSANDIEYGKLYHVAVVVDNRGVCPAGWHIPTDDDWKILEISQGMSQADADRNGHCRGTISSKLLDGGSSGLNFKKAGWLMYNQAGAAILQDFGKEGYYWTSTSPYSTEPPPDNLFIWNRVFGDFCGSGGITRQESFTTRSIRCIKD